MTNRFAGCLLAWGEGIAAMPSNPLRHHDARDYWYFVDPTTHKQVYLSRDKNTAARKWREIQGGKPILPSGAPTSISEATARGALGAC